MAVRCGFCRETLALAETLSYYRADCGHVACRGCTATLRRRRLAKTACPICSAGDFFGAETLAPPRDLGPTTMGRSERMPPDSGSIGLASLLGGMRLEQGIASGDQRRMVGVDSGVSESQRGALHGGPALSEVTSLEKPPAIAPPSLDARVRAGDVVAGWLGKSASDGGSGSSGRDGMRTRVSSLASAGANLLGGNAQDPCLHGAGAPAAALGAHSQPDPDGLGPVFAARATSAGDAVGSPGPSQLPHRALRAWESPTTCGRRLERDRSTGALSAQARTSHRGVADALNVFLPRSPTNGGLSGSRSGSQASTVYVPLAAGVASGTARGALDSGGRPFPNDGNRMSTAASSPSASACVSSSPASGTVHRRASVAGDASGRRSSGELRVGLQPLVAPASHCRRGPDSSRRGDAAAATPGERSPAFAAALAAAEPAPLGSGRAAARRPAARHTAPMQSTPSPRAPPLLDLPSSALKPPSQRSSRPEWHALHAGTALAPGGAALAPRGNSRSSASAHPAMGHAPACATAGEAPAHSPGDPPSALSAHDPASQAGSVASSLPHGSPLPLAWDAELDTIEEAAPPGPARPLGAAGSSGSLARRRPLPSVPALNLAPIARERDVLSRNRAGIISVLSESGLALPTGGDALVMGNLPPLLEKGRSGPASSPRLRFRAGAGASSIPCDMSLGGGQGRGWAREGSAGGALSYVAAMSSPRSSVASGYGGDAMQMGVGLQGLL